ncbi:HD domain-containing protein [bacterium]|nr:HD domain-containing protein [bacterium]
MYLRKESLTIARIQQHTLLALKSWFDDYVNTYRSNDPQYQRNMDLKYKHTLLVCKEIRNVGRSLNLDKENLQFAEITALFHDVGRFEQYKHYGTFIDLKSENHSTLGINILQEKRVLKDVQPETQSLIFRTILNHNQFELPRYESEVCLFFSKLLRDADKLDIWRLVTEYYLQMNLSRNNGIELDLPDAPEISDQVYDDLISGEIVRTEHLRTLNDFKLLQMGWVYDINFLKTYKLVQKRGILTSIRNTLPQTKKINKLYDQLNSYLHQKAMGG